MLTTLHAAAPPIRVRQRLLRHEAVGPYIEQGYWLQVFLFLANEKGASWAYATPGFGATLSPAHLKMLRQMAMPEIDEAAKVPVSPLASFTPQSRHCV